MQQQQVVSDYYKDQLQTRYQRPGWGGSGHTWAAAVWKYAHQIGATSILDYGCGRGTLKPALEELGAQMEIREYDPGIVGKDDMPSPADLVVATDVLEHIEPSLLGNVFKHIDALSTRGIFLNIACGPAKEILPDGRNAHLIQRPAEWWRIQLQEAGFNVVAHQKAKGFIVWIRK